LHTTPDPAIVFPPNQQEIFDAKLSITATGFLVSIISRANGEFVAKWLGTVHVDRLPEQSMNWGALESLKGDELPAEMRNGLLRFVFNRRPGASGGSHSYVTPRGVLDGLERPWYKDGASLAWELDDRFVGGAEVEIGYVVSEAACWKFRGRPLRLLKRLCDSSRLESFVNTCI
jgi:hypothetical protein